MDNKVLKELYAGLANGCQGPAAAARGHAEAGRLSEDEAYCLAGAVLEGLKEVNSEFRYEYSAGNANSKAVGLLYSRRDSLLEAGRALCNVLPSTGFSVYSNACDLLSSEKPGDPGFRKGLYILALIADKDRNGKYPLGEPEKKAIEEAFYHVLEHGGSELAGYALKYSAPVRSGRIEQRALELEGGRHLVSEARAARERWESGAPFEEAREYMERKGEIAPQAGLMARLRRMIKRVPRVPGSGEGNVFVDCKATAKAARKLAYQGRR